MAESYYSVGINISATVSNTGSEQVEPEQEDVTNPGPPVTDARSQMERVPTRKELASNVRANAEQLGCQSRHPTTTTVMAPRPTTAAVSGRPTTAAVNGRTCGRPTTAAANEENRVRPTTAAANAENCVQVQPRAEPPQPLNCDAQRANALSPTYSMVSYCPFIGKCGFFPIVFDHLRAAQDEPCFSSGMPAAVRTERRRRNHRSPRVSLETKYAQTCEPYPVYDPPIPVECMDACVQACMQKRQVAAAPVKVIQPPPPPPPEPVECVERPVSASPAQLIVFTRKSNDSLFGNEDIEGLDRIVVPVEKSVISRPLPDCPPPPRPRPPPPECIPDPPPPPKNPPPLKCPTPPKCPPCPPCQEEIVETTTTTRTTEQSKVKSREPVDADLLRNRGGIKNTDLQEESLFALRKVETTGVDLNIVRAESNLNFQSRHQLEAGISGLRVFVEERSKQQLGAGQPMDFVDYFVQNDGCKYIGVLEQLYVKYLEKVQSELLYGQNMTSHLKRKADEGHAQISEFYKIVQVELEKQLQDYDFPTVLENDTSKFRIEYLSKVANVGKMHNYGVKMILYWLRLLETKQKPIDPQKIYQTATELMAEIMVLCYSLFVRIAEFLARMAEEASEAEVHKYTLKYLTRAFRNLVDSICDEMGAIGESCGQVMIRIPHLSRHEVVETMTNLYTQINYADVSISRAVEAMTPIIHLYYIRYFIEERKPNRPR